MKKLLTYKQFNEQYLPYFGVKQALDDSEQYVTNEEKTSDFHRIYTMTPSWWIAWKKKNGPDYGIKQDAFSKTYEVTKGNKVIFIFDYGRNKVFTNEPADFFLIKTDIDPNEYNEIEDKAEDIGKSEEEIKKEEEIEKELEKNTKKEE
jgi:hypothetical protein